MSEIAVIADMVREAERHADDQAKDRIRAVEYYNGVMKDTPADEGRSQQVSRDLRSHVKKVLPSIVRTILGANEVVEYSPVEEGDEEAAEQASDFINYVVLPESSGKDAIYDAVHDALLVRNGILKWWHEEKRCVKFSSHSGLTEDEVAQLLSEEGTEVVEQSTREEVIEPGNPEEPQEMQGMPMMPMMPQVETVYDLKIRRETTERRVRCAAVPRERFLIDPDAVTLEDSILTGEKTEMRRSDLIALGYDKELINSLSLADDDDYEEEARRDHVDMNAGEAQRANDEIDYYDLFIRVDLDGDGIAELRHMCFAGGLTERNMLHNEEVDEVQFCDVAAMRQPHQWEGVSLSDDLCDIQRVKTVLLRQTLDNLYWQNNPQPIVDMASIQDPESVFSPEFGKPITIKQGADAARAYQFARVPFVAKESFGMLEYLDGEATDRTGVSDASAGLAPDALQNMTAKASAMIEQAGIGQTEMMVRTIATSLKPFFRGLLRLIIRHQDKPRTVRLRDEWVTFDPRQWNATMDVTVNTGLGAGTRERDMLVMQQVMMVQEKLLAGFGPDNPFVKPENVGNAVYKLAESAGLNTPALFFTQPDPQEVQQKLQAMREQPNPEQMKIDAQMQLEQAKMQAQAQSKQADLQANMQLEQLKMQTQTQKERAQMEADLATQQAAIAAETQRQAEELAVKERLEAQKIAWERERFAAEIQFKREMAEQTRQDEIGRYQADAMTAAAERQRQEKQETANG